MDSLRYYELYVPPEEDPQRLMDEGLGLFPSVARHAEADGWWAVTLLDDRGVERALEHGLDPQPATREALDPGLLRALDLAEGAEGDARPAGGAGTDAPQPNCDLRNRWCQYEGDEGCGADNSIVDQLTSLQAANPDIAELVQVGPTSEGNTIHALRVGVLSSEATDPLNPVKQLVIFGTQHAREWAATGLVMDLAKRVIADINASPGKQLLMSDRSVLFVPVANPDGYIYTFDAAGDRLWRKNRQPCLEEPALGPCGPGGTCAGDSVCNDQDNLCYHAGVDPNRNFAFNFGITGRECVDETYEGSSAASAAETTLLNRLLLHQSLPGQFVSRFLVNYHSYGSFVLYSDGLTDDGADGLQHNPCRAGVLQKNCQPPEFGVLRSLSFNGSTETSLRDEFGGNYTTDTVWRALYDTVGDEVSHHGYSYAIPDSQRSLGVSVEVTNNANGFFAECIDEVTWDFIADNHQEYTWLLLYDLANLSTATAVAATRGSWLTPRIHRLLPDDEEGSSYEYGKPRFFVDYSTTLGGAATISSVNFADAGQTSGWNVRGLFYKTARWWNNVHPWLFPAQLRGCVAQTCQNFRTDAGAGLDLCSPAVFTQSNGWTWVPDNQVQAANDCYMRVSSTGNGPFVLRRRPGSLVGADRVHLNYSYRIAPGAFDPLNGRVDVYVEAPGRTTMRVRTYPHRVGQFGIDTQLTPHDGRMRSENVLLPQEYANTANITVRFEAKWIKANYGGEGFAFEVYDVALIGRSAP